MKDVLSPAGRRRLAELARRNLLIAFDYDGTLAPISLDPARAGMRQATARLLSELAGRYPVAAISGRALADMKPRLGEFGFRALVGNHGAELAADPKKIAADVRRWRGLIARALAAAAVEGIELEDKKLSLSVHFRKSPHQRRARMAVLGATHGLDAARLVFGKRVVNVVHARAPNKGTALERLMRRERCTVAVFVGDDETDEDVFRLDRSRVLSIRVGKKRSSVAGYYVRNQAEVDTLLRALVDMRRGSGVTARPPRPRTARSSRRPSPSRR